MASQSQDLSAPPSPLASETEKKRKRNDDATVNAAMISFGGYVADEEAEGAPSSQVKSSKKKRKKHKKEKKKRQSQIAGGDEAEEFGTQVTFASSPSSRKHRKVSTPSGDEDEDQERDDVTPTPPAKRRHKSDSEKAARKDIDNDGYDATEEETEVEKKRSHAETPIRPPPRNHVANHNQHATTKVIKRRSSRKAKVVQNEQANNGISSDADSMRTKLSSNISTDMFARPPVRRVTFDSTLVKPMSALSIRGREAVDDRWEEATGRVRGLVHTSGDAEAEESTFPTSPPLSSTLEADTC